MACRVDRRTILGTHSNTIERTGAPDSVRSIRLDKQIYVSHITAWDLGE